MNEYMSNTPLNPLSRGDLPVVDEEGNIVERYEYDAYGRPTLWAGDYDYLMEGPSGYNNPYYFTGRRLDVIENGSWMIQYHRNRFYDYKTGRWLNQDPIGYQDGPNLYAYVHSNPVNRSDPQGLLMSQAAQEADAGQSEPGNSGLTPCQLGYGADCGGEQNPDNSVQGIEYEGSEYYPGCDSERLDDWDCFFDDPPVKGWWERTWAIGDWFSHREREYGDWKRADSPYWVFYGFQTPVDHTGLSLPLPFVGTYLELWEAIGQSTTVMHPGIPPYASNGSLCFCVWKNYQKCKRCVTVYFIRLKETDQMQLNRDGSTSIYKKKIYQEIEKYTEERTFDGEKTLWTSGQVYSETNNGVNSTCTCDIPSSNKASEICKYQNGN